MAKPSGAGLTNAKVDHRKKKNARSHEDWQKGKKIGRPKQVFVNTAMTVEELEQLTDAQILALPKPHWEKVSN